MFKMPTVVKLWRNEVLFVGFPPDEAARLLMERESESDHISPDSLSFDQEKKKVYLVSNLLCLLFV